MAISNTGKAAAQRPLKWHLRERRGTIAVTYGLSLAANGFSLLYPFLIGIAINGLVAGRPMMLLPIVGVWCAHIALDAARQIFDTRLFSKIFRDIAVMMTDPEKRQDQDDGSTSEQVNMAREYIEFFEWQIPSLLTLFVTLFGSIIMLFFYDIISGIIVTLLLIPIYVIVRWLTRQSIQLNRSINDQKEKQVEVIASRRNRPIKRHFGRMARWEIRLSNADATGWTLSELFSLLVFVAVLYRLASVPDATAGGIFAGVAYLLKIVEQLDYLPDAAQDIGRLIDINRRVDGKA